MRCTLALLGLLLLGSTALADQYLPPSGSAGQSSGTVMERRAGTTGNTAAPVDELNPMASRGLYKSVQVAPTVTATSYSSGYVVGGLLTFTNLVPSASMGGFIQSAVVTFLSNVTGPLDLIVFSTNPTTLLSPDHAAVSINALDLPTVIGVVHVNDCTLGAASTMTICQNQSLAGVFGTPAAQTLYGVLVARASMTLGTTADVTVALSVGQ